MLYHIHYIRSIIADSLVLRLALICAVVGAAVAYVASLAAAIVPMVTIG